MKVNTRPNFPADKLAVAILGFGQIARTAHLPAYQKYGVPVAGVWSRSGPPNFREELPYVGTVYSSIDRMLADPDVSIIDIATGPAPRVDLINRCIEARKHVLAQKPLVDNTSDRIRIKEVLRKADSAGIKVAVNQNARWAPAWRAATCLIERGEIGDVVGVTHLHDKPLPPIAGTHFDELEHMLINDYLVHWVDITRLWLGSPVTTVWAYDSRVPGQSLNTKNPWSATINLQAANGATGSLRVVGNAIAALGGAPFWIHGTQGTLRGSILLGSDSITLERKQTPTETIPLEGEWFVDGFAGTLAELMTSINENREPENSASDALNTVNIILAAAKSAQNGGQPEKLN